MPCAIDRVTCPFTAVVGLDDLRAGPAAQRRLPRGRRRAGPRREGHRQVHGGAGAGRAAARGRRRRRLPLRLRPGRARPGLPGRPARRRGARATAGRRRLVELPVGATEDRVVGSLDLERALADGRQGVRAGPAGRRPPRHPLRRRGQPAARPPGRPAAGRRRAWARAYVEREGVSVRHAARFLLVGTMNPEEGELRPQLLDRFGLTVEVRAPRDPDAARRGGPPAAGLRRRPGRVRRARGPPRRPALARADRRGPRAAAARRACPTARCARSPRSARPSRSTGCAPTSSPPARRSRTPPGTAATR